jgi:DNA-binding NarL/FixJ family response regulator
LGTEEHSDAQEDKGSQIQAGMFKPDVLVPTTIFCDRSLSFLEALVEYLKEQLNLSYQEIAVMTNRDERNIWTLYHRAEQKRAASSPDTKKSPFIQIPLSVVTDRSVSILEVVVEHLRDKAKLSNHQIATLLNRSDKTVSTVYMRTVKKRTKTHAAA